MNDAKRGKDVDNTAPRLAGEWARIHQAEMTARSRARRAERERGAMEEQLSLVLQFFEVQQKEQADAQKTMSAALFETKTRCDALFFDLAKVVNECVKLRAMLEEAAQVPPPLVAPWSQKTSHYFMDNDADNE